VAKKAALTGFGRQQLCLARAAHLLHQEFLAPNCMAPQRCWHVMITRTHAVPLMI